MAPVKRVGARGDERGVVYVEFLIAFLPLFVLFLGICQLALITSAKLVVRHAASVAVRSAIVVLEESPERHDGAPRGSLSEGQGTTRAALERLFGVVGVTAAPPGRLAGEGGAATVQSGARMVPIRVAAYTPLLVLAPDDGAVFDPVRGSLGRSVRASLGREGPAVDYTRAASAVTLHVAGAADAPAEPVAANALITARVTYLFNCSVPLAKALMCDALGTLLVREEPSILGGLLGADRTPLGKRMRRSEAPGALERHVPAAARFIALSGAASLPNQGADYYREGG